MVLEGAEGPSALGIPPWCRTLGDEPAKTLAILSQDPFKDVDERGQSERAKDAAEWSGELDLGEEHDAPTLAFNSFDKVLEPKAANAAGTVGAM